MSEYYTIIEPEWNNTGFDIRRRGGQKVLTFDLIRDDKGERLPIVLRQFPPDRMPPVFDQYRRQNGVYVIVDAETDTPLYVGESHTERLIHTATRHIQKWNLGPSWNRDDALFGFIVCTDPASAYSLQNLVIAEFILNGVELLNNTQDRPMMEMDYDEDATPF